MLREGRSVIVTGRDESKAAKLQAEYPGLIAEVVDAGSQDAMVSFFERYRPFDALVLSVSGAKGSGPFQELKMSELLEGFQEKFFLQVSAAQAALPYLSQSGSITFVSAISARAANPGTAGLAAINGAIEAMIKPLAGELKPLRVTAVSPGVVETP